MAFYSVPSIFSGIKIEIKLKTQYYASIIGMTYIVINRMLKQLPTKY